MKVTKAEQETVVNFDEESNIASVYTYNSKLKIKLAKIAEMFPQYCKKVGSDKSGSVTYELEKDRLMINFRYPISEKQREALNKYRKSF